MHRGYALGLVALGIVLAIASVVQHSVGVVPLGHGALFLGAASAAAVAAGAALWIFEWREAAAGGSSGRRGSSLARHADAMSPPSTSSTDGE